MRTHCRNTLIALALGPLVAFAKPTAPVVVTVSSSGSEVIAEVTARARVTELTIAIEGAEPGATSRVEGLVAGERRALRAVRAAKGRLVVRVSGKDARGRSFEESISPDPPIEPERPVIRTDADGVKLRVLPSTPR